MQKKHNVFNNNTTKTHTLRNYIMVHSATIQVWPPRARKKNKKRAMQLEMIGVTGMNQDIKQSNTRF